MGLRPSSRLSRHRDVGHRILVPAIAAVLLCNGAGAQDVPAPVPGDAVKFYNLEKEYRKLRTAVFTPGNAEAIELKQIVAGMLSTHGTVYANEKSNTLYVTDVPEMIEELTPVT